MAQQPTSSKSVFSRLDKARVSALQTTLNNSFVQLVAFGLFLTGVVLLVSYDFDARASALDELEVGQVAQGDVTATRSFTFTQIDTAASEKQRDAAANEVPNVFDWQEGQAQTLRNRVTLAFEEMRKEMARVAADELEKRSPREHEVALEASGGEPAPETWIELLRPQRRISLAKALRKEVFDPTLGVAIRDSDFEALAQVGFSANVEAELADICLEVMGNIILPSMRIIEAEQENGIFLRRLRDEKVLIEYHVDDISGRFLTMERVPALVEEVGARRLTSIGDRELRQAIVSTATALIQPNTFSNPTVTAEKREAARQGVDDQVIREDIRKGQVIVSRGDSITDRHLKLIDLMLVDGAQSNQVQSFVGVVLFCVGFLITLYIFGRRNIRKFRPRQKDIIFMAVALLGMLMIMRLGDLFGHALIGQFGTIPIDAWHYAIPIAAGGMLVRLVLNSEHASVFVVVLAALVGVMASNSLFFMCYAAIGGFVGAGAVRRVKNRMTLMWSGLLIGGVNALTICAFLLIEGEFLAWSTLLIVLLGVLGGILSGLLVSAILPIIETIFEYTTDIKLLELANLNHPALRELIVRAPGSYHHSMMVGSLCEAAAEAIGCNSLLVRVGAYYHDIGKGKNPQYFAENQQLGDNPHDRLKPNMSALVIKAHVKDGLELARQHRLPQVIQDFIAQHHGTSLIAYFYHKARELEDPDIPEVNEKDYRYPGPKPQSRETAICLLADGVEAASRAMREPTPARLKGLVQKMINKAFTDGQLDECELTLKDLNAIAQAFVRILTGIYHHRPEYPEARKKAKRAPEKSDAKKNTGSVKSGGETDAGASDVWELTEERKAQERKEDHDHRDNRSPGASAASDDSKSGRDAVDEGRESLPRLGTDGS